MKAENWQKRQFTVKINSLNISFISSFPLGKILINSLWNVPSGLFKISEKLNNHLELWFSFQNLALNASSHVKHFVNEHVMAANQNIMESQTCLVSSGDNKKERRVWWWSAQRKYEDGKNWKFFPFWKKVVVTLHSCSDVCLTVTTKPIIWIWVEEETIMKCSVCLIKKSVPSLSKFCPHYRP